MYLQKQSFLVTFYGLGCFNITEVKAWEVIECFRILTFSQCAGAYKTYGKCHIFRCLLLDSAKGIFDIVCKVNVDLWISGVEVEADWADCRSKSEDHHGNHHHHWDKRTRCPLRQVDKIKMILAPRSSTWYEESVELVWLLCKFQGNTSRVFVRYILYKWASKCDQCDFESVSEKGLRNMIHKVL